MMLRTSKPPYCIPSMAEIAAVPFNGYRVASTFSGCGGSSLGYRMAGFKVAWANEFIPAARDTYRANFPATRLDERDIRQVEPREILDAAGLQAGELDLLDGSPPCASFSMAGKRQRHWGQVKSYSDSKQRTDDLFFQFVRLLRGLQPRVFVAENVSGLVKGVGKGFFLDILAALKDCGYRVEAQLLDAQWLGVPQARQRLFFVGTRFDLATKPAFPAPLAYRYSVRDALPWIGAVECANGFNGHAMASASVPAATVQSSRSVKVRTFKGSRSVNEPAPTVLSHGRAHTQSQMTIEAEADMSRYSVGRELNKLGQGEQSTRYFQLTRASLSEPSPTITVEGKKAHAASVAHPTECRKFSIAELRAICGFPADFVLTGTYAQQWERLGRAVPPPMMAAIAATIRDRVLDPVRSEGADRSAPSVGQAA
jgi:DNA (cytosine-5)-methyltransferase 1